MPMFFAAYHATDFRYRFRAALSFAFADIFAAAADDFLDDAATPCR